MTATGNMHNNSVEIGHTDRHGHQNLHSSTEGEVASTHTHTHPFNGPLYRTTWVSQYQKGKTNLDFTEARVAVASAGP